MRFTARMMDAATGGEGSYEFEGANDLWKKPADEIVAVFFDHVEKEVLKHNADWELNGALKNKERGVVTAMGSLIIDPNEPALPFLLMIAKHTA